jgi:hypothetical protein
MEIWTNHFTKDGDTLQRIIDDMSPHRPIIQIFNEPYFGNDYQAVREYSRFSAAMALNLWERGAQAAVGGWSTGVLDHDMVLHMGPMLDVCRDRKALFEYHAYSYFWPTVWMGRNQSHGIDPTATQAEKWLAIWQDPEPDFADPNSWLISWLTGRIFGIPKVWPDGRVTFGIPELFDVPKLLGEGVVDHIYDVRLPARDPETGDLFGGVNTTKFQASKLLGIDPERVAVAGLEIMDDFLDRFKMAGGENQVDLRMAFAVGPGYNFEGHDLTATEKMFNYYLEYLRS